MRPHPMLVAAGIIAALVLAGAIGIFNRLIGLKNRAAGAWSDIDVQLKRRHDVVGNLVQTVKGYVEHERETLERVVEARARAEGARQAAAPAESGQAEARLTGRVTGLLALAEAYPDLKASERFLDLQRALTEIEDAIQNARRYYNAVVRDLNTRIESFPDMLLARPLRFRPREFFELDSPVEARVPQIDLQAGGA